MNILDQRIKKLRKGLNLTQQEFADRLGTTRNNIAGYEIGRRSPSEAVISLICKTFNVSEVWLRTGEGEMFEIKEDDAWDEVVKERGLTQMDRILIEKFMDLKPSSRQAVIEYMEKVVVALNAETVSPDYAPTPVPAIPVPAEKEPDIIVALAEMKRQNKELQARLEVLEKEEEEKERRHTKQSVSPARSHTQ